MLHSAACKADRGQQGHPKAEAGLGTSEKLGCGEVCFRGAAGGPLDCAGRREVQPVRLRPRFYFWRAEDFAKRGLRYSRLSSCLST